MDNGIKEIFHCHTTNSDGRMILEEAAAPFYSTRFYHTPYVSNYPMGYNHKRKIWLFKRKTCNL